MERWQTTVAALKIGSVLKIGIVLTVALVGGDLGFFGFFWDE
jgi:hypothetical protein